MPPQPPAPPKNAQLAAGKVKFQSGQRTAERSWLLYLGVGAVAVVVVVVLYFLVFGAGPQTQRATIDATIRSYTDYTKPYVPPSASFPTQPEVRGWLAYFDADSQRWFRENIDALSRAASRTDLEAWKGWAAGKREMEAMRQVVAMAPLRGVVLAGPAPAAEGDSVEVEVLSGTAKFKIRLEKTRDGWVFDDLMGVRERLEELVRTAPPAP